MKANVLMNPEVKENLDKLVKEAGNISCDLCRGNKAMKFGDIYICPSSIKNNHYSGKEIGIFDKLHPECLKHIDDYIKNGGK